MKAFRNNYFLQGMLNKGIDKTLESEVRHRHNDGEIHQVNRVSPENLPRAGHRIWFEE